MSLCPRCRQPVDLQAIACPTCRTPLKAHGHPGIPLHRADGTEPLCQTCLYHEDDSCNYPQRPLARECTLYTDRRQAFVSPAQKRATAPTLGIWLRRHQVWLALGLIILISLLIAIGR